MTDSISEIQRDLYSFEANTPSGDSAKLAGIIRRYITIKESPISVTPGPTPLPLPSNLPIPNIQKYTDRFQVEYQKLIPQNTLAPANWYNYYGRDIILKEASIYFGDPSYIEYSNEIMTNYRDTYVLKNNGVISPHESQLEGMYYSWLGTKDPNTKLALSQVANCLSGFEDRFGYMDPSTGNPRVLARVLTAMCIGNILDTNTYKRRVVLAMKKIIDWQSTDGSFFGKESCDGQLNYMVALLCISLIKAYEDFDIISDPIDIIKKSMDFILQTQVCSDNKKGFSFNYNSCLCTKSPVNGLNVGGPTESVDLNNFFAYVFLWLAKESNSLEYYKTAVYLFNDCLTYGFIGAPKQFNQAYYVGFRFINLYNRMGLSSLK